MRGSVPSATSRRGVKRKIAELAFTSLTSFKAKKVDLLQVPASVKAKEHYRQKSLKIKSVDTIRTL